jgi:hypothetical protein
MGEYGTSIDKNDLKKMMDQITSIETVLSGEASLGDLIFQIVSVLVMAQILCWHYIRFANVLSNKPKFGRVLVFLSLTTFLVISVVKTSLALSLGLVGALSIIRFRTPIKEPEELAYLFLAISVGIGVGADQSFLTVLVFTLILAYMGIQGTYRIGGKPTRSLL